MKDASFHHNPSLSRRTFAQATGVALAGLLLGVAPWELSGCAASPETRQNLQQSPDAPGAPAPAFANSLSAQLIDQAASILDGIALATPLVVAPTLSTEERTVMLRLESLQKTGSFKLRGAYTMIAMLTDEERAAGVVTCSAGNHAQGVAYAAREFGIDATIFIPADAPQDKIEATRAYGVEVRLVDGDFDQAKAEAEAFVASGGGTYIPPYDDYRVMAGQGTIGRELLTQSDDIDAVIVPVGGGGLIGGVACALKTANPSIAIYGVESEAVPSMHVSLAAGKRTGVEAKDSLADGIHVAMPGEKTFEVVQTYVDGVYTVTEQQIAEAIVHLARREKVVAEGAGATTVAAVLSGAVPLGDAKNVVCLISGGNIDPDRLSELLVS
ncbi:threonine/serine dehydratase [Eggerthella sp. YY7918]|uniref:threonine ammonia-lyase n=1 Tax=Eggerthella sp. (strain YY7918) TaxID=502558 RepID=UPI000217140D|nr:threonine/serine dehydratase [Eggerthella sp. YY7918]BAK45375.1 threonine dehydratase [Eggerthella sp. YY7918]